MLVGILCPMTWASVKSLRHLTPQRLFLHTRCRIKWSRRNKFPCTSQLLLVGSSCAFRKQASYSRCLCLDTSMVLYFARVACLFSASSFWCGIRRESPSNSSESWVLRTPHGNLATKQAIALERHAKPGCRWQYSLVCADVR